MSGLDFDKWIYETKELERVYERQPSLRVDREPGEMQVSAKAWDVKWKPCLKIEETWAEKVMNCGIYAGNSGEPLRGWVLLSSRSAASFSSGF